MTATASKASPRAASAGDLALIAVFASLIAVFALTPAIPVGALGVPITLQTLAVALTGLILGPWRGFLATALYVVVGLAGLPVFAGGTAGLGAFARPSVGYLLSFPFAALAGFIAYRFLARHQGRWGWLFVAALAASLVLVHPAGIVGMSLVGHLDLGKAALLDLPFWPGDIAKMLAAAVIAAQVHRAFPRLADHR